MSHYSEQHQAVPGAEPSLIHNIVDKGLTHFPVNRKIYSGATVSGFHGILCRISMNVKTKNNKQKYNITAN